MMNNLQAKVTELATLNKCLIHSSMSEQRKRLKEIQGKVIDYGKAKV